MTSLYSCGPFKPAIFSAKKPSKAGRKSKHLTVDIHCHVLTPAANTVVQAATQGSGTLNVYDMESPLTRQVNQAQMAAIGKQLTDIETRLADMDAMGVDIQALSPAPPQYYYNTPPELGRKAAQIVNDNIASIVAAHPDRFVGLGTVPMQQPELAVAELVRAVKTLGLRGVEICTNIEGVELSDPRFRPFFAKAEELDVVVFLHPNGFTDGKRLNQHYFINVIGNPLDSTVAVGHLIFGGVLEAYPKLKICVAHGGGYAAAYGGRMDHAHAARPDCREHIKKPPSHYLKKLYFDSIVFTHDQLAYLAAKYGADHVLLGTDYPFDMGEPDPVGFIAGAKGLGPKAKAAMLGGTAAKLLKIRTQKTSRRKKAMKTKGKVKRKGR